MAITPTTIASAIFSHGLSELKGPQFVQLALGIGNSVMTWIQIPVNFSLSGITNGQAGAGVVNGFFSVPPTTPNTLLALQQTGNNGPKVPTIARAVSLGISTGFSTAQYVGPSVGVSIGNDLSQVSNANVATLIPLLVQSLSSSFGGPGGGSLSSFATGLASGIVGQLSLGRGTGIVTGIPAPIPPVVATGTSPLSKVF